MTEQPPGWLPDPYGRYQQRYWDGTAFTGRVRTGDDELDDPLGASTSIPFAIPQTALPAANGGSSLRSFLRSLGDEARDRPSARVPIVLAGLGGALVAGGFIGIVIGSNAGRAQGIISSLVVIGLALGVRFLVPAQREARSAAVGAGFIGIGVFYEASFATADSTTWPLVAIGLTFVAAWLLPGFRGRPLMLGFGAIFLVAGLVSAATSDPSDHFFASSSDLESASSPKVISSSGVDSDITIEECDAIFADQGFEAMPDECFSPDLQGNDVVTFDDSSSSRGSFGFVPPGLFGLGFGVDPTGPGLVAMLCAAALLAGIWWLDRNSFRGVATSLVPAALIASTGSFLLATDIGGEGGAFVVVVVGLLICWVGGRSERRVTTWWGALFTTGGALAFAFALFEPSSSTAIGVTAAVVGLLLVAVPALISGQRTKAGGAAVATE